MIEVVSSYFSEVIWSIFSLLSFATNQLSTFKVHFFLSICQRHNAPPSGQLRNDEMKQVYVLLTTLSAVGKEPVWGACLGRVNQAVWRLIASLLDRGFSFLFFGGWCK